ncbi:MAG: HDIG domain-containing protein [Gemmataceae bacterium]
MFGGFRPLPARIAPWIQRQRTDDPTPRRRWHATAARLLVIATTTFAATAIAFAAGPPIAYRLGEIPARDLRVRVGFELVNGPRTEATQDETEAAQPIIEKYPAGIALVKRGKPITSEQLSLLRDEERAYRASLGILDRVRRAIALFAIIALLTVVLALYVSRFQIALAADLQRIVRVCILAVATLAIGIVLSKPPWYALLVPMAVTAMVLTLAYNPPFALLMSFSLALVATLALGSGLEAFLVQMGGLATAILLLRNVRTRPRIVQVAAGAGLACLAMTFATGLLCSQGWKFMAFDAGRNLLWFLLGGFVLTGSLPIVERAFAIVTDISLVELANSSHPLLQELIRRAPGTYTHSITVATLAESAAEAIGANTLVVRVGSYFHDVGKMLKPQYFVENQDGHNRHDDLEPALSTLVIVGHVKDGVALAQQHGLPKPVVDLIQQHHGTTLVECFYREALRSSASNAQVLESTFRYPGPKPHSREAAIVMLADAVESASRSLTSPTPSSLRKLVRDLSMRRLLDGQFEASGLTLTELSRIEESLGKSISALFHARIRYPNLPDRKAS